MKIVRGERVLIVGTSGLVDRVLEAIEADKAGRYCVLGVVAEDSRVLRSGHTCAVLGSLRDLGRLIQILRPRVIVLALEERERQLPIRECIDCIGRGVTVENAVDFQERLSGRVALELQTPASIIFSRNLRLSRVYVAFTRVFGVAAAVAGLVLLAPLFFLIALGIKLDSDGPVLFIQPRVGAGGRTFPLLKFRTMRSAEHATSEWVHDNRGRITRLGQWLRKLRLDELPQLVNVLRGDMNIVGPRPHPVSNLDTLRLLSRNLNEVTGLDVPYYTLRTLVRPGITGWAQVRYGYANNFAEEIEKLRYDLYYIKHASAWLDLRILLETVHTVLRGHDAGLVQSPGRPDPRKAVAA